MHWYVDVLKKYATFSGRARRAEFWMFSLLSYVIGLVLVVAGAELGFGPLRAPYVLYAFYVLALFLPSLAVRVRRLHDTGRGGSWLLIGLIPLIGDVVLLVFYCSDSQPGENEYGPVPKYIGAHI
ncbi:DUF805 domain-containing protein [Streptomyces sp. NPDC002685]|uniref:DUF805 domain-containing protein n=1 Tax=Streptomyces sp. NPDC002685 TaxID=3154540 RepID=UPI0033171AB4